MKMMLKQVLASSLVMVSAQAAVADNGISYNYIDLHYVDLEEDNIDADGLALGGSYRLSEKAYIRGEYQDLEVENRFDLRVIELGAGYIHPYNSIDFIAEINAVDIDADNAGDDDGFRLTGGMRTYFIPDLEGRASVNHDRVGSNDTYFQLGANYRLRGAFSVDGSYDFGGWWDCPPPEVSKQKEVKAARADYEKGRKQQMTYKDS